MRLHFLLLFLVAQAASVGGIAAGQGSPNFLLLLSDDQQHRALGFLRECEVKTPNLDQLARRGLVFTHCFLIKRDPWELHNLAPNPKYAATIAQLDTKLRELMRQMDDPLLPTWPELQPLRTK